METQAHGNTGHMGTRNRRVVSAGTMTGDSVRNLSGDDLGNVQEIMLDVYDGSIAYAVLSFGGFLGMGDKLFAVPWKAPPDGEGGSDRVERGESLASDLEAMEEIAQVMATRTELGERFDLVAIVGEFPQTLLDELDYRQEARNLERLGKSLEKFDRLLVPRPIMDFTTSRVLVMEWVSGLKITSLSPLRRMEMDGEELASQLFEAYLQQVLVDGFFHADPHPGNLSLTADHRIALLDLGMVARISSGLQEKLVRFLMAVSEGEGEEAAQVAMKLGEPGPTFDEPGFVAEVAELVDRQQDVVSKDIELGKVVLGVTRTASEHGGRKHRAYR